MHFNCELNIFDYKLKNIMLIIINNYYIMIEISMGEIKYVHIWYCR